MDKEKPLEVVDGWQKYKVLLFILAGIGGFAMLLKIFDTLLRIEIVLNQLLAK